MICSVASMQKDVTAYADKRWSGTGGFELVAETSIAVTSDLNTEAGRREYGLHLEDSLRGALFVPVKVGGGDDAGCFNLNHAQNPRLLGVAAEQLSALGAFTADGGEDLWHLMASLTPDGHVPAIVGDMNTAMWGLKKNIGTDSGGIIRYTDEQGRAFSVKLVASLPEKISVFHGSVLIPDWAFTERYPSREGYGMFLVDTVGNPLTAKAALSRRFSRAGMDVVTAVERLAGFHSVEAAYLRMFLVLGGLGLLLGGAGLGIVVLRNGLERQGELALLHSVGFRVSDLRRLLVREHALLLGLGLGIGTVCALVAMWPNLRAAHVDLPLGTIAALLAGMVCVGMVSVIGTAHLALRGPLMEALRTE